LIEDLDKVIECVEGGKWDEARDIVKNSVGAVLAVNAIKNLQKNGGIEREVERIKSLKQNFLKLIEGKWLSELDVDYFTLLFAYFERVERRLQEAAYVKSVVKDPDKE